MNSSKGMRTSLWVAVLALVFAVAAPTAALAQGRGKGNGKNKDKCAKFVNCHDASEGRVDGRGPSGNRGRNNDRYNDRYDDRDDDYYRNGRYNTSEIRRVAQQYGYDEGYRAGIDDRNSGRSRDYQAHRAYQDATYGYNNSYGDVDTYRRYFRDAYRQGYNDGYRGRSSTGSRVGDILGGIFGRP